MARATTTPQPGSQFSRRRGDPALGGSPLSGPPRNFDSQLYPGTVAIVTRDPVTQQQVLVGIVETSDLRLKVADANPRWREVWKINRWDLFWPGTTELPVYVTVDNQTDIGPVPAPTSPTWRHGVVEYNYVAFDGAAAVGLGGRIEGLLPGQKLYFEAMIKGVARGWLYRTIDERGSLVYDVWVLSAAYKAPAKGNTVSITPRTNPYADADAALSALNTLRQGASDWLAMSALYWFTTVTP